MSIRLFGQGIVLLAMAAGLCTAVGAQEGEVVRVVPGNDLEAAIRKARSLASRTVLFAPGDYFLAGRVELGKEDSGLTLKAERPGTARLWGGVRLTKWTPDGDGLFACDVDAKWDSRTLLVDGIFAPRAEMPGGGKRFKLTDVSTLQMRSAMEGFWNRPPTERESRSLGYRPEDIPPTLDIANAELRLFHVWSESLVGIASNVVSESRLWFLRTTDPIGACGRYDYIVYNTREGMKEPGQWYLDRTRGKVVYYPRPDQDPSKMGIVLCRHPRLLWARDVANLTIDGLSFWGGTPPLVNAGFAGMDLPAEVEFDGVCPNLRVERFECAFMGGTAFLVRNAPGGRLAACHIHDIGGIGMRAHGEDIEIVSNRIERIGVQYPGSCGAMLGGDRAHVWRNTLTDGPYTGIFVGGVGAVYEENRVARVMRVLSDGAAFYGGYNRVTIRNNVVEDIHTAQGGYGGIGLYCDEGGYGNVFENNLTVDVPLPIHMHKTRGNVVRNNTFVMHGNGAISFQDSRDCAFESNRVYYGGTISYSSPDAFAPRWKDNEFFGPNGIERNVPPPQVPVQPAKDVLRVVSAPPGSEFKLNRDAGGRAYGGGMVTGHAWWTEQALHLTVKSIFVGDAEIRIGTCWGANDGVRFTVNGRTFDCFPKTSEKMWLGLTYSVTAEIPWKDIGVDPKRGLRLPFNVERHCPSYRESCYFEGSAQSGVLELQ